MEYNLEEFSKVLFEIASTQRLGILLSLREKELSVSKLAKKLEATVPEVFRNCERLSKADLIKKNSDGNYRLTLSGETVFAQIPSLVFISLFKNYFKKHYYGNLPEKFIQRIGSLCSGQHIKGVVKVLEQWSDVYKNADKYVYNILIEVPYNRELIDGLNEKMEKGVKIKSIFSESAIVPRERKKILGKINFKKFIDSGIIERRMLKNVQIGIILNEKEACVMFPSQTGDTDASEMLYDSDSKFHEWCLDYFRDAWEGAGAFKERKLK